MRKLLLLFTLLLTMFFVNGQIKKGALIVGGDFAYRKGESQTMNSGNNYEQSSFLLLPAIGIAIKQNLVTGISLLFYTAKNDLDLVANDYKRKVLGVGVFMRRYKPLGKSDFFLFLQGRASVEFDHEVRGDNSPQKGETDVFRIETNVYPGVSYRVSKRLQLESGFNGLFGISYAHYKGYNGTVNPSQFEQNSLDIFLSLENLASFYVGFRLLFNK